MFPILSASLLLLGVTSCTKLEDSVVSKPVDKTAAAGNTGATPKGDASTALQSAYARLNDFADQSNTYAMEEHPSDEMMGPTRGTDWDDFGTWRKLHQHTWDATHNQVNGAWDNLNNAVFRSQQADYFASDSQTQLKAEAKFLKAFYTFYVVDLFGQLPTTDLANPASGSKILSRSDGVDVITTDLDYAIKNMASGSPGKATKEAAQFLLAKTLLNKAVYKQDTKTPAGPFTFAKADMDKVVELCNTIIASKKYDLAAKGKYFDNFHWENSTRSKELVFVIPNENGSPIAGVQNRYRMTTHYNFTPDGWNGFTTLADFYNSFEKTDERIGGAYPGVTDKIGTRAGFLAGQQFDKDGKKLKTRGGADLSFTGEINLAAAGEERGIRVIKYLPQPGNFGGEATDYILFRYSDVLLMKAEAILRGGSDPLAQTPAAVVNSLRTIRGASSLSTVDLPAVLAERGRELYWEGWRRNDQIRFSKFTDPVDQRPNKSADYLVVFPIPQKTLDVNPTWSQNFGY